MLAVPCRFRLRHSPSRDRIVGQHLCHLCHLCIKRRTTVCRGDLGMTSPHDTIYLAEPSYDAETHEDVERICFTLNLPSGPRDRRAAGSCLFCVRAPRAHAATVGSPPELPVARQLVTTHLTSPSRTSMVTRVSSGWAARRISHM